MARIPLKSGTVISGDREYIIDSVAGDGANCFVYNAHYIDSINCNHSVLLKECYPYESSITRTESRLIWELEKEQRKDIAAFVDTYESLMEFQNYGALRNSTSEAFDIFEANGTQYSVINKDNGVTFDHEKPEKLLNILEIALALTKAVKLYHDAGYLHLDIKPSNFLVIPETNQLIKLFDMDSVVKKSDVINVPCVSYSAGWAAPEQMLGQRSKICEATDLFSIGAIIFEKIFGRKVENSDIGVFADWSFDGALFDNINPKIKRQLRNIFHKTLAANVDRRYQSADELAAELKDAIKTSKEMCFLLSDHPICSTFFVGRSKELKEIDSAFECGKKVVVLHGFAGIGKSEIVLKHIQTHEHSYDAIVFKKYHGSLKLLIESIKICNNEADSTDDWLIHFRTVLNNERVLLVVDNFDTDICDDEYFRTVLSLPCDVIITTRTNLSDLDGSIQQIEIGNVSKNELVSILDRHSGQVFAESDTDELFNLLDYHTYAVELVAKHIRNSGCSIKSVIAQLRSNLACIDTSKVLTSKDGAFIKSTVYNALRNLFKMEVLSEENKRELRNLYLLRNVKVDREFYGQCSYKRERCIDSVNELVALGWIQELSYSVGKIRIYYFKLHSIAAEIVRNELKPSIGNCELIASRIESIAHDRQFYYDMNTQYDVFDLYRDKAMQEASIFCAFLNALNFTDINDYSYAIEFLYNDYLFFESDEMPIKFSYNRDSLRILYDLIRNSDCAKNAQEKIKLMSLCVCESISADLIASENGSREYEFYFEKASSLIESHNSGEDGYEFYFEISQKICYIISKLESCLFCNDTDFNRVNSEFKAKVEAFACSHSIDIQFFEDVTNSDDEIGENNYEPEKWETFLNEYLQKGRKGEDRLILVNELINDDSLTSCEKLDILDNAVEFEFRVVLNDYITDSVIEDIKKINWDEMHRIMKAEQVIIESLPDIIDENCRFCVDNYYTYLAALAFIRSEDDIHTLTENFFYTAKQNYTPKKWNRPYDSMNSIILIGFLQQIENVAFCTEKQLFIAPYYVEFCEWLLHKYNGDNEAFVLEYEIIKKAIDYLNLLIEENESDLEKYTNLRDKYLELIRKYKGYLPDTM